MPGFANRIEPRSQRNPNSEFCYYADRDRDRDRRDRDRDRDSERRDRDDERERARIEKLAERERKKELDAIKEQYLGSKKPKKKRFIKPSDKFRLSFDWENEEDTSRDMNVLCPNPHEFGSGLRAGMDRLEQKKLAAKEKKFDMRVDRHWSEKKLEEMTERDWRIFREDFNISYKASRFRDL